MKNVHILPTSKSSSLRYFNGRLEIINLRPKKSDIIYQNIYITSDEELKMGDWVYSVRHFVGKFGFFENSYQNECKKIILTDNQDLIKDGVQEIDDEFLEWFVQNPSCEEVKINRDWGFPKIIIPKEEPKQERVCNCGLKESEHNVRHPFIPRQETLEEAKQRAKNYMRLKGALEPKQETLEEVAEKFADDCTLVSDAAAYKGFIAGAKYQQERMHSEVIEFAEWCDDMGYTQVANSFWKSLNDEKGKTTKELFEQFKKK